MYMGRFLQYRWILQTKVRSPSTKRYFSKFHTYKINHNKIRSPGRDKV